MHGFSAHLKNEHARITFRKSFAFTCPRIRLSRRITIQNALFFCVSKRVSKAWFETALCSHWLKSGFQIRKGPNHVLKRLSERDSSPCEHSHCHIFFLLKNVAIHASCMHAQETRHVCIVTTCTCIRWKLFHSTSTCNLITDWCKVMNYKNILYF